MKKILPALLILLSVVYWYVFARFVPPPPLAISRETTYFTDLKEVDGRYSLVSSINELYHLPPEENALIEYLKMSGTGIVSTDSAEVAEFCSLAGIDPEQLASPTLVLQLPSSDAEEFVLNLSEGQHTVFRHPWHEEQFPKIAAIIEANADTFALLASMAGKKGFYWPRLQKYPVWNTPVNRDFRPHHSLRLLLARGMLRLRSGELRHAWEDLASAGKAARPLLQSDMITFCLFGVVGMKDTAEAMKMFLHQQQIDEEFLRQMLVDLDEIIFTRGLERAMENETRFFQLSMYLEREDSLWSLSGLDGTSEKSDFERYVDKNVLCRKVNQFADEFKKIYSIEDVGERIKGLGKWENELDQQKTGKSSYQYLIDAILLRYLTPADQKCTAISEVISDTLMSISGPRYSGVLTEMLAVAERFRLLKVAVLMRLHKLKAGDYPASLDALEVADKQILIDSFSGRQFNFRSEGKNIMIYSIGPNQRDELGATGEDAASGDITIMVAKF